MAAGRDAEFTEYVSARTPWLRRIAFLLCGDRHHADDLVQTCITRLYLHWGRAAHAENLDGYVRRSLVNVYLDEQRSGWVRWTFLGRTRDSEGVPVEAEDVALSLDLRAALARLPARQRTTVVLRFYCDLSVEQTAEVMRCTTGNVKSQTARGLVTLRRLLDPATIPVLEGN